MARTIDYYFTPPSPWTYLGHQRLEAIATRHGAQIAYKPADFGRVFAASGGLPLPQRPKQRQAYRLFELERWRERVGIALNVHPRFFPVSGDLANRLIIAARQSGAPAGPISLALMRAVWVEDRNISDPATLATIADELSLDGSALVTAAGTASVQAEYDANTQEAIDRQVFGAPWYDVGGIPFWGQDRLDFLEALLTQSGGR